MSVRDRELWCRRLGISFAILLGIVEVFYNWSNPSWWPFILVDYIAVGLLLYGSWKSHRVLAAGWGFACAMFYMAFFLSWELGEAPTLILVGMAALFAWTIIGLILSLSTAHEA